jgi:hypothetical protein
VRVDGESVYQLRVDPKSDRCRLSRSCPHADYLDHVHMRAGPNKRMNEEMLDFLQVLDKDSTGTSSA